MAQAARHIASKNKTSAKSSSKKGGDSKAAISKSKRQAKKILNALNEAEQIHKGKRKGTTLDEFLEDL